MQDDTRVQVYGANWCPDCTRAKRVLSTLGVPFDWHDIDSDPEALRFVEEVNGGRRIIPTIVLPDGSILAEPSNADLIRRLQRQDLIRRR